MSGNYIRGLSLSYICNYELMLHKFKCLDLFDVMNYAML